ncbi:YihY/virulence factor BrkB family protein [Schleiferia thermophila]|uniref:YihY/virulence factor BrkB family protein n=1 Tax=Schleiferia thermophila TaxID=884107 RepID=UPI0004E6A6B3|nr:YihY/virulence factor BrkB family protein [Schleiferia thermophila]KFD40189.1 ribonuclease BN [Schleiferia thermophila str. Yellowstone]
MKKIQKKLKIKFIYLSRLLKKIKIPFFQGQSIYDVLKFFYIGIVEGNVTSRAASVSFSFFLALFPGLIFIFTLIPYIPIEGFQEVLFDTLKQIMPPNTFEATESTIYDIINNKRGNLLSFGFIAALLFATNGTNALINNFNSSVHQFKTRNFWRQELVAIFLTLFLSFLFIIGIVLIIFTDGFTSWLVEINIIPESLRPVFRIGRYILLVLVVFISISLLYYFGPADRKLFKFFSPGSILATVLIVIGSELFSFYISNFNQYNKLYGSIGTLLVILIWIYINSLILIIGFEFNAGIAAAKREHIKSLLSK